MGCIEAEAVKLRVEQAAEILPIQYARAVNR